MSKRFFDKDHYVQSDLEDLISNEIEESLYLDFKASGAIDKTDIKKREIAKHVSAFANSDGGIIIYGIIENNHRPESFDFIDGNLYNKEWLENVIDGNIQQRIQDIEIIPIRFDQDLQKTVYIIKIPRSQNAPHISSEKIYYRRFNFKSVPMEEYEVRLLYSRVSLAEMDFHSVISMDEGTVNDENGEICIKREIHIHVINVGNTLEKHCKIEVSFQNITNLGIGFSYDQNSNISHKISRDKVYVISAYNDSPIFPEEEYRILKFRLTIRKEKLEYFQKNAILELTMYNSSAIKSIQYDMKELIANKLTSTED